jgi:hypothetical protein
MITRIPIFFICLLAVLNCRAQILPVPGAKLNYNQVMFEYEKVKGASMYLVQVEDDTDETGTGYCSFEQTDSATATMISGFEFGRKYHWRYAGLKKGQEPVWKGPYYFEVADDTLLKRNIMNIVVSKYDSNASAGGLIVNDCTHTIIDRHGNLVWYLDNVNWKFTLPHSGGITAQPRTAQATQTNVDPAHQKAPTAKFEVRPVIYDLRMNPYGTITDMEDSFPIERDLNCNILWKAPNDGKVSGLSVESYNHDFKRLPNGHYMILGNELWRKLPTYHDSVLIRKKYPSRQPFFGKEYARVEFGTVIEYDKKGNVVWSWNSQNYFDSDALKPVKGDQRLDFELKPHINAFGIDKKNEFVYVGFRDISRIVKVEKATGKVVDSWGQVSPTIKAHQQVAFHQQHDAQILDDGNIAIFNNNDYPGRDSVPSVIIFSQQPEDSGNIIWKYTCRDSINKRASRTGGNVEQLKNGNLLVCMGNLDRMFEITMDKRIVWQAEIKPNEKRSFSYLHRLYRAHYISSLYPCYFVFETDKDTVKKREPKFSIRIFNKGSESDAYNVKITSPSGAFEQQFSTSTLEPNRSETITVKPTRRLHKRDKIEVTVNSQLNPDLERKSWVVAK